MAHEKPRHTCRCAREGVACVRLRAREYARGSGVEVEVHMCVCLGVDVGVDVGVRVCVGGGVRRLQC